MTTKQPTEPETPEEAAEWAANERRLAFMSAQVNAFARPAQYTSPEAWQRHRAIMDRVLVKHADVFRALALSEQLDRQPYDCEKL